LISNRLGRRLAILRDKDMETSKNLAVLVSLWFDETGFALGDANAGVRLGFWTLTSG
jgi:hypothetical protein